MVGPVHCERLCLGRKEAGQPLHLHVHIQHVAVGTKVVADGQLLAVLLEHHIYGAVGLCCGGEAVVVGDDVVRLACQRECHVSVLGSEYLHVPVASAALVAQYFGALHHTAQCGESKLHAVVLQDDVFTLGCSLCEEKRCAVGTQCAVLQLVLLLDGLCFGFGLLLLYCGYAVLTSHLGEFFLRRAADPVESNQHQGYQHEACNCVFVHVLVGDIFIFCSLCKLSRSS